VEAYDRADQNRIASGTLETVDNTIDPNTGTSRLKAIFDNPHDELFPNQFVNCRLLIETRRRVALIPVPAVQRGPQGSYVYVIQPDGTAAMRPVTLGASEGNDQQITSGIAPGEMVVTDGQDKLEQGSKVQVRQDGAGGAGGGTGNPPNAGGAPAGRPAQGGRRGGRGQ
jgi:multidrug efflux system membrane fusion protein